MRLHETIFCASGPADASSSAGPGAITFHDIQTNTSLATFKQTSAQAHCTALVESQNGQGGLIFASQPDKAIMNVYNFQKDQIAQKIVLPEKLVCVAVDARGDFCAGGTASGRVYLWEIASGLLYNAWDAHYRALTVLRFTGDGAALVSGSADSGVHVWEVSRLVDDDVQTELPAPFASFSDHTLPVTDIVCGAGAFPACRILTAAEDSSVKVWDLAARTLLTTFHLPAAPRALAWDPSERVFFAAAGEKVYQVNLFRRQEAVGGQGVRDVVRIGEGEIGEERKRVISVGERITTLALSLASSLLLVGTATGRVHTYDTTAHQRLRTLTPSSSPGLSVTALGTLLRPPDLMQAGTKEEWFPMSVKPFARVRDAAGRERREVDVVLDGGEDAKGGGIYAPDIYSTAELTSDHAYFFPSHLSATPANGAMNSARVAELEAEVGELKTLLGRAKGVNDAMWETVVREMIQGKSGAGVVQANGSVDGDGDGEEGRSRKRGRT